MWLLPSRSTAGAAVCFTAAAVASLLIVPAASQAQQAPWSAVPSPNATPGNNVLAAVSAASADDVWAVGQAEDANGNSGALTEHWNGSAWNVVASPAVLEGNLLGVAAISPTNVWAVGSLLTQRNGQQALIEHWNGTRWSRRSSPVTGPGSVLNAITVAGPRDIWAVGESLPDGSTAQTLTEHWDGASWSVVPSADAGPQNNLLTGAAAVSSTDVWAVGHFLDAGNVFHTLTENWNGASWRVVPSPSPAGAQNSLNAVASSAAGRYIWAVGDTGNRPLIEQWNGTSWVVVHSATRAGSVFNQLRGVAIVNGSDAWAVGQSQDSSTGVQSTLIEQWNGLSWSIVPSPNPGSSPALDAAAADPTSGQVWAVGFLTGPFGAQQTLTEFKP